MRTDGNETTQERRESKAFTGIMTTLISRQGNSIRRDMFMKGILRYLETICLMTGITIHFLPLRMQNVARKIIETTSDIAQVKLIPDLHG